MWHVVRNGCMTCNHDTLSDPARLVNRRFASEDSVVADADMPAKEGSIGKDHMAADSAIMSHMARSHQKAILADNGHAPRKDRAIDRHVLAQHCARANLNGGWGRVFEVKILGRAADDGERMDYDTVS